MKKLYKDQKYTIYEIQEKIGLAKDTLYKYARGTYKIENMPVSLIIDIAYIEKVEVNWLYNEMLKYQIERNLSKNDK